MRINRNVSWRALAISTISVAVLYLQVFSGASHTVYESQIIGNAWFGGESIPLVQAYSTASPMVLYLASLYGDLGEEWQYIVTGALVVLFLASVYLVLCSYAKQCAGEGTVFIGTLLLVPGVWQGGLSRDTIGITFILLAIALHARWRSSRPSYWLFGTTARNWRLLLGSSVCLAIAASTGLIYVGISAVTLVVLLQTPRITLKNFAINLAWYSVPLLLTAWVWISFFASRGLIVEALRAAWLDVQILAKPEWAHSTPALYVVIACSVVVGLAHMQGKLFYSHRRVWLTGLATVIAAGVSIFHPPMLFFAVILGVVNLTRSPILDPNRVLRHIPIIALLIGLLSLPYVLFTQPRIDKSRELELRFVISKISSPESTFLESPDTQDGPYELLNVFYYGRGSEFYRVSGLPSGTRFYNATPLIYSTTLLDNFRGDAEANKPKYIVEATSGPNALPTLPRFQQYLADHYEHLVTTDHHAIYHRIN